MDKDLKSLINEFVNEVLPPEGDLPIGGEEKYLKQHPGGQMSTANVDGHAWGENITNESNFRVYNTTLCPVIWGNNQHLDPMVREHLLKIAYDFYEKTDLKAPILDVYLMGSIANYNWTPDSDADVHVIINFDQLQMPPDSVNSVVKTMGAQWNMEHKASVKGYKVELNIQNKKEEKPHVTGIYSLVNDIWVRKPSLQTVQVDTVAIQSKYRGMKRYIESSINSGNQELMKSAKKYLDAFRQYGLDTVGEISVENVVFKILRARGIVKKLKDSITIAYDTELSVKEKLSHHKPIFETNDSDYNASDDFFERRDNQLCDLAHALKQSGGKGKVTWNTVPASLLKRTWIIFGKYNKINENDLDKIADRILTNIARLQASTEMMGHTSYNVRGELEDNGYEFTEEEWDIWMSDYFTDKHGNWLLSDYGLEPLKQCYGQIFNAETPEEKLYAIDKALNIVHQRSDLASLFIEGGTFTLRAIFNQGGYTSPDSRLKESFFYKSKISESSNYHRCWWLSPDSKFYNVSKQNHGAWARDFLTRCNVAPEELKNSEDVYNAMFKRGWIRVAMFYMDNGEKGHWGIEYNHSIQKEPTNLQIRAIRDMGIECGAKWMRDDTFEKENELEEITQKDIKATYPSVTAISKDYERMEMMTLDNLKSLRDKSARLLKLSTRQEHPEHIRWSKAQYEKYNGEIKRRLSYINQPLTEEKHSEVSILLIEGRIDDFKKKYETLPDDVKHRIIHNDPSPNKKYIDWIGKNCQFRTRN